MKQASMRYTHTHLVTQSLLLLLPLLLLLLLLLLLNAKLVNHDCLASSRRFVVVVVLVVVMVVVMVVVVVVVVVIRCACNTCLPIRTFLRATAGPTSRHAPAKRFWAPILARNVRICSR